MKILQHMALGIVLQIDQNILATDQVEPREWGVLQQIMACEYAHVTDRFYDLVVTIHRNEVPLHHFYGKHAHRRCSIDTEPGFFDRTFVQVGGEDLYLCS